MKIKTYSKKHGIYNISADIHLIFPKRNSLTGYFTLQDLSVDAKACFEKNMQHSDLNEFVKMMDAAVEKFLAKNQLAQATHKKLLYICYSSRNRFFLNDQDPKSVDIDLSFDVLDTYWSGDILLKIVNMQGKEMPIEHNRPKHLNSEATAIPYTKEAEDFIQDLVKKIALAQSKLQSFFQRDYFNKNELSLDEKINLLINSKQKLLDG